MGPQRVRFFERLDRAPVLSRVTRTATDVREAQRLEELADRALVVGDPEALHDDALQIDPTPAYDPVHSPVRAGLDELPDRARCSAERRGAGPLDQLSSRPSGPWPLKRWTQSRSVCRSIPPIRAASVRFIPSRNRSQR